MDKSNQKERLPGETSVSHSSDEFITNSIDQLQRERDGVNNTVLDGDTLTPKLSEFETAVSNDDDTKMPDFTETFAGYSVPEQTAPTNIGLYTLTKRSEIKREKAA